MGIQTQAESKGGMYDTYNRYDDIENDQTREALIVVKNCYRQYQALQLQLDGSDVNR